QDQRPLPPVRRDLRPAVVRAGGVLGGAEEPDAVEVRVQQPEQHHEDHTDPAQWRVHARSPPPSPRGGGLTGRGSWGAIGCPAGRRAVSEIRSNRATSSQLEASEDPPADRNGVVSPVSGTRPLTPPRIAKICSPSVNDSPPASSLPNESRTVSAARRPRVTISR